MVKALYSILLVGTAGGVGLALVVGWLNFKLYKIHADRRRKSLGVLLLGILIQNGILTFALIDAGTTVESARAYLYALGMLITTVGLGWKAGQFVADLALKESIKNGHGQNGMWLKHVEERLTAEEHRNTDIEEYARELKARVKKGEERADEAEARESE